MLVLPSIAILSSLLVSAYALYKGWKQPVIRLLVLVLVTLASEQFLISRMIFSATRPSQALSIQEQMMLAQVLSLILALGFSFGYGRMFGWEEIKKRKLLLFLVAGAGLVITLCPAGELVSGLPVSGEIGWVFVFGLRGQLFYVFVLLISTLILINLEKLLRSSYGRIRWQLKFSAIGLGTFFALRIYQSGYALVFNTWQLELDGITSIGLILSCLCLAVALRRTTEGLEIYISTDMLQNSIAAVVVGAYLISVGMLVALFRYFSLHGLVEKSFLIVAGLFLVLLLVSDRFRQSLRLFTSQHFRRPDYDYRSLWRRFNDCTVSVFDEEPIAGNVVRLVSERLQLNLVAIWIHDSRIRNFRLAGSSSVLEERWLEFQDESLLEFLENRNGIIDPAAETEAVPLLGEFQREVKGQGIIPLKGGGRLLGFMAFGQKVSLRPLTMEEREILDMLGQQTAGVLLNVSLFRKVAEVSEIEALRNMSAFFLHDVKNIANQLSLTVENLPRYYDNEDFRKDAFQVLSDSVQRIRRISSGMNLLRQEINVQPEPVELSGFIHEIIIEMRSEVEGMVREELGRVPKVSIDREQLRKVIVNLLLNARDAVQEIENRKESAHDKVREPSQGDNRSEKKLDAPILVSTYTSKGQVVCELSDRGCGMSRDFLRNRLFQPFQTTKDQGMGVGLFQSRMIVEALQGRIEVESEPGKGATFRVIFDPVS